MNTEPKIILTDDLSQRGYVSFYFNGKRHREYNGKKLGLIINPNYCKTYADRLKHLKKLEYEIRKALESGWDPTKVETIEVEKVEASLQSLMNDVFKVKETSDLSITYLRDLRRVMQQFLDFTSQLHINQLIEIDHNLVERFLNQFSSSATYYMGKRRALNVFFSEFTRNKKINNNPVECSVRRKQKASLHKVYSKDQIKAILNYLEMNYPNLHICCLLTYGCLLRPHQEIRLLSYKHISDDCTKIILSGSENKSKRIRVVNVPSYIQDVLKTRLLNNKNRDLNILSNSLNAYNVSYLNTQWSRAKKKMAALGLIQKDQTIYSFRHTAVVNVYNKTKDLHILQHLLQHSNMIVTLNYLRGLGEINNDHLKDVLPEL